RTNIANTAALAAGTDGVAAEGRVGDGQRAAVVNPPALGDVEFRRRDVSADSGTGDAHCPAIVEDAAASCQGGPPTDDGISANGRVGDGRRPAVEDAAAVGGVESTACCVPSHGAANDRERAATPDPAAAGAAG